MQVELQTDAVKIPPTFLFGHPTRLADSWRARMECVFQPPAEVLPSHTVVRAEPGTTWLARDRRLSARVPRRLFSSRPLDLSGTMVFDARFDTDQNVAHQISGVMNSILVARRALAPEGGPPRPISVILKANAARYTQDLYNEIGIPVVATDAPVIGDVVRLDDGPSVMRFANGDLVTLKGRATQTMIGRDLPEIDVATGPDEDTPEKLFISRRDARALVNNVEVSRFLAARGFREVYFDGMPTGRQIRLTRHARTVVAIHGAAVAYLAFNPNGLRRPAGDLSGLKLIELFGAGYQVDKYRTMAARLNAHWCAVRGPASPAIVRDLDERKLARSHQAAPFAVDLRALELALDYAERSNDADAEYRMAARLFPEPGPAA